MQWPAWCFACEKMRTKLAKLSDGPQNVGAMLGMLRDALVHVCVVSEYYIH